MTDINLFNNPDIIIQYDDISVPEPPESLMARPDPTDDKILNFWGEYRPGVNKTDLINE